MGEIADALRKANAERDRTREARAHPAPLPAPEPEERHGESAAPAREERRAPAPPPAREEFRAPPPPPIREERRTSAAPPAPEELQAPPPPPPPAHVDPSAAAPSRARPASHAAARAPQPDQDDADLPVLLLDGEQPQVDHTRHLALRIKTEMERRGAHSVLVASPLRNEGKTTVSCNLAIALASVTSGRGIALVDFDLRNPSIGGRLGIDVRRGIDEAILEGVSLEQSRYALREPRIDVYPVAKPRPSAHELLVGRGFEAVMRELHARYELIVVDSPPTLLVPDSTLILREVDCCVTVAHAGITRVRMFKKMLDTLPPDQVIGKVLNAARAEKHQREYYAYGYGSDDEAGTSERGRGR